MISLSSLSKIMGTIALAFLLEGCFGMTRTMWTGPVERTEVTRQEAEATAFDAKVYMEVGEAGPKYFRESIQPIQAWSIPLRVIGTPIAVVIDLVIAPFARNVRGW